MRERRFVIREVDVLEETNPIWTVTEAELNQRWKTIRSYVYMHMDDRDLTNVLLHGETAQAPIGGKQITVKLSPEEATQFERAIGAERAMDRLKEQPIILSRCEPPKPTRKEWEEWIESFVEFSGLGLGRVGMDTLIKILLNMPGIPKE